MANKISLVVLSRYNEIFERFRQTADTLDVDSRILVRDRDSDIRQLPGADKGWITVPSTSPFNFAENANAGILSAPGDDVLLCNDDIQLMFPDMARTMQEAAYDTGAGIVSPRVIGGGQDIQINPPYPFTYSAHFLAFICVFIPRDVLNRVGLLDTRFDGYGMEDVDYCVRVRKAGHPLLVLKDRSILHGGDGRGYSTSFFRAHGWRNVGAMNEQARSKYLQKWEGKGLPDIW